MLLVSARQASGENTRRRGSLADFDAFCRFGAISIYASNIAEFADDSQRVFCLPRRQRTIIGIRRDSPDGGFRRGRLPTLLPHAYIPYSTLYHIVPASAYAAGGLSIVMRSAAAAMRADFDAPPSGYSGVLLLPYLHGSSPAPR